MAGLDLKLPTWLPPKPTLLERPKKEKSHMPMLVTFVLVLLLPILIYALQTTKLISARTTDILMGVMSISFGAGFLVFAIFLYIETGHTLHPSKHGPITIPPDGNPFNQVGGVLMCIFLGGGLLRAGWSILKPKSTGKK